MTFSMRWCILLAWCCVATSLWAGGSGLNVVVVVNQQSSNSVQLGNYYCEQRQVPPQNYLRMSWPGSNITWTSGDFTTNLFTPLIAFLSSRQLTNQVDFVVLSMDIPYEVTSSNSIYANSSTSALFYGYKPITISDCFIADESTNLYAGSEGVFRSTPPISLTSNSFLVTMITSSNLTLAEQLVDSGVSSDATFPTQTVYLCKSTDTARNVRYVLFDNAIFDTRLRGNYSMMRTNAISTSGFGNILGAETGYYDYGVYGETFAPGSMADNLTSNGGDLFDGGTTLDILTLLGPGAAGGYGSVSEPCNYLAKFPNPLNYFYQARGFSLAECFYQSVTNPYQGILVGEPLAAPFAQPATGSWTNLPPNARLTGTTNLSFSFLASDAQHPVQQVDLFIDGNFAQTITNIAPAKGNIVSVEVNGFWTNYTVASGDTISSIASNLTTRLNQSTYAKNAHIAAYLHGDRIELQSTNLGVPGSEVSLSVSNSATGSTFIADSGASFLDTIAYGIDAIQVSFTPNTNPPVGDWLLLAITKTNGTRLTFGITNTVSGTTTGMLISNLMIAVNASPLLSGPDGVVATDFIDYLPDGQQAATFNLQAQSYGWEAAQIQANLTSSSPLLFQFIQSTMLDSYLGDLRPRAHLYITAGTTNLAVNSAFNTTTQIDGFHELTAVAYEGSHVGTQAHISQTVCITNNAIYATLTPLFVGTNVAVGATLQFSVVANTAAISNITLLSTGGSLASVAGQSNATFSVPGTNLDLGLHPFYALVTTTSGKQFRTQTQWIRLSASDAPFTLSITNPPVTLSWPATPGRGYDVLSTTNLQNTFQPYATLMASNSPALFIDTNPALPQRFYQVHTSP
jgi:uncharacterized protein (TIGR03790 family)